MRNVLLALFIFALCGCLKTRSELKTDPEAGNMRTDSSGSYVSGSMGQQQRAQIDSRFFEIDRDFRELYGKIETLERNVSDIKAKPVGPATGTNTPVDSQKMQAFEKRLSTIEEALLSLDKKITTLSSKGSNAKASTPVLKPKGPFGKGELLFEQGEYEKAIASYDTYRKRYPRGKRYAQATLKMGLCFQKLKMNQDAKAFYKEVIQRYPNTRVSIRAKENLKSI